MADVSKEFMREINAEQGLQEMPKYQVTKKLDIDTIYEISQIVGKSFNISPKEVFIKLREVFGNEN